jgi:hypothetical protein
LELVVDVPAGGKATRRLALDPGRSLAGSVLDAEGRPVAGATVHVVGDRKTDVTTDAQGAFTVHGLDLGAATLAVDAAGFLPAEFAWSEGPAEIVFRRGGLLRGRLLDAAGIGIAETEVCVHEATSEPTVPARACAHSDFAGRFELRAPAGRWKVAVVRAGARVTVAEIDLTEGTTSEIELRGVVPRDD